MRAEFFKTGFESSYVYNGRIRSIVITDGLQSYRSLLEYGYMHSIGKDEEELEECRLSRCYLVIILLKRNFHRVVRDLASNHPLFLKFFTPL